MSCALLLKLLSLGTQVDENEMRLAIDITATTLTMDETVDIPTPNEVTKRALLQLLNDRPNLIAVEVDGTIKLRRMNQ